MLLYSNENFKRFIPRAHLYWQIHFKPALAALAGIELLQLLKFQASYSKRVSLRHQKFMDEIKRIHPKVLTTRQTEQFLLLDLNVNGAIRKLRDKLMQHLWIRGYFYVFRNTILHFGTLCNSEAELQQIY